MTTRTIAIINESSVVTDAQLAPIVAALQIQVTRDFAPEWGSDAQLVLIRKAAAKINAIPSDDWQLVILDTSDDAGALGYHDTTPEGLPLGKVFAKSDIEAGSSLSVTMSHELLEMLADPDISTLKECQYKGKSTLMALEIGDPVEDDKYGYEIEVKAFEASKIIVTILVSDFIYPRWFHNYRIADDSKPKTENLKFDHMGHCKGPFDILEGGYISVKDPIHGWSDIQKHKREIHGLGELMLAGGEPSEVPLPYSARARVGSRRERRRTPRELWQRSKAATD